MTLVEVLISALLVSVIAIGTFTAFDTAGRASQDQRTHALAGQLAQADEEHLRALTQAELTTLTNTTLIAQPEAENGACVKETAEKKWEYTATPAQAGYNGCSATAFAGEKYTGVVFLVTTSARFVSAASNSLACETAGTTTDYIQTTSSVRWKSLLSTRPAVTQSSIVNDSVAGLLVKVFNQNHEPESGVAVTVTGVAPAFSSSQTTPPAGCVIVTGITNSSVKVAVTKLNFVDRASKSPPAEQTVPITPGKSASVEFIIGEAGKIEAEFFWYNSGSAKLEKAESDTFYARQGSITPPPLNFIQGTDSAYVEKETLTPVFPFALPAAPHEPEPYSVYAGDCEENNPHKVNAAIILGEANEAKVKPGGIAKVTLEVPKVTVKLYKAATKAEVEGGKIEPLTAAESAEIVNSECAAVPTAQNAGAFTNKHTVAITATGGIKPTYEPYAKKLELCVIAEIGAGKYYKFLGAIKNEAQAGTALTAYMKAPEVKPEHEKSTTKGTLKCP